MIGKKEINILFKSVEKRLFDLDGIQIYGTTGWYNDLPNHPGVYTIMMRDSEIVYVGETTNIRERMKDLNDTRHHTLRRAVGHKEFVNVPGFHKATSKTKFPDHIEELVTKFFKANLCLTYCVTKIGRKEFEEYLVRKYKPKFNSGFGRRHKL